MKYLCHNCVGDFVVTEWINDQGSMQICYNCEQKAKAINLVKVAEWVDPVYRENYMPSHEYPSWDEHSDHTTWETQGDSPEEIISEMLEIDLDIAEDIVSILSGEEAYAVVKGGDNPYYESTSTYESTPILSYQYSELWDKFCQRVKHVSRFFDTDAIRIIDDIFHDIDAFNYIGDKSPIRTIGAGTSENIVYRARRVEDNHQLIQMTTIAHKEMGPPPPSKTIAGRMNPTGIPVFYGALDRHTCVSEIRLPVGGMALTAKFEITKPLCALDLTIFQGIYERLSLFDPEFETKASRIKFLREFERQIRRPILPADELYDYIPTQAFAEYLANHYEPKIDAVIFSSAQTEGEGKNIVILSHVAAIECPPDVQPSANKETTYHADFGESTCWIIENTPQTKVGRRPNLIHFIAPFEEQESFLPIHNPSLRLVPSSLKVVTVKSISHTTESLEVRFLQERE